MKLYYAPAACSLSPHIVALEAGLDVEMKKVDLGKKSVADGGNFLDVNGKGYVPALELPSGEVLTEGPAIVQYLADQNPDSRLAPRQGTIERYRLQEWLNFITAELHKSFSPLFNKDAAPEWKAGVTAHINKRFDWLATQLDKQQFLMGDQFTVADAYLFTVLNWTKFVGIDLAAKWPSLAAFQGRVAARPKVQQALKEEGLA